MWAESDRLESAADCALFDQLSSEDRAFHVQSLAVVDHILLARPCGDLSGFLELAEGGEWRLIGKVVLARGHDAASETTPLAWHRRGCDEFDRGILKDLIEIRGRRGLRVSLAEFFDSGRLGIIHPPQGSARLDEAIALPVNVPMVEVHRGKRKIARPANGRRFAFRGIVHSVQVGHEKVVGNGEANARF